MTTVKSHRTVKHSGGTRPGIRLTRRGRVTLVLAVVAALMVAFWLGTWQAGLAATADRGREQESTRDIVELRPGQTLWEVAVQRAPEADPRRVVHRIVELNDLPSVSVRAGQRIVLPHIG